MNSTAEGIYGIDTNGVCTFCNQSALKMLGYSEAEVLGEKMHDLIHHSHQDGTPLSREDCQIFRAWRENENAHVENEFFWKKDGKCFPVEYWSRPYIREGEVRGAVVSFQDISERIAIRSRLEEMGKMIDASHDAIIVWELGGKILRATDVQLFKIFVGT